MRNEKKGPRRKGNVQKPRRQLKSILDCNWDGMNWKKENYISIWSNSKKWILQSFESKGIVRMKKAWVDVWHGFTKRWKDLSCLC
jgi:hypothetical protein